MWKNFFHDTPFQMWGYTGEGNDKGDRKPAENNKKKEQPAPDGKQETKPHLTPNASLDPQTRDAPEIRTSNDTGDYPPPISPTARVNNCPTTTLSKKFCIYYQNVRGLRNEEKLEFLTRLMEEKKIDAFILTETHLEGDFQKVLPRKQIFIHHGPETQPRQGAKGGIGIILSPELTKHWKNSKNKILLGGTSAGGTTRFMSVVIKLKILDKTSKNKVKYKNHNLALVPYYAPHSGYPDEDIERTTQEFSEFLNKIPTNNTTVIIGADLNASIGTRITEVPQTSDQEDNNFNPQEDNIMELLGPHGNPHRNENGERILNLMREHDLRAASTFFYCNNKHNT
jgi:hypothetical protein